MINGGSQPRTQVNGAVDVVGAPARATHHVMVIVTGTALESGGVPCRLDPAHQPGAGAGGQHVVQAKLMADVRGTHD